MKQRTRHDNPLPSLVLSVPLVLLGLYVPLVLLVSSVLLVPLDLLGLYVSLVLLIPLPLRGSPPPRGRLGRAAGCVGWGSCGWAGSCGCAGFGCLHKQKKPSGISLEGLLSKKRRLPTLPRVCSTIGAGGLNFSVRNGKRWNPATITT